VASDKSCAASNEDRHVHQGRQGHNG
jgi:hypothetical protein